MTTTYTSTHSRPCADCGLRRCPAGCGSLGLLTSVIPVPERTIYMEDGSNVTVPVGHVPAQHPSDYVTMTGLFEAIGNGPQSHVYGRGRSGRVPVWAVLSMFVGVVLMALCWVFNDATTRLVWSILTG